VEWAKGLKGKKAELLKGEKSKEKSQEG